MTGVGTFKKRLLASSVARPSFLALAIASPAK
jgi:hypothetical protein